ncbi:MAG: ribosomal protein S18-alanine N-acetyltransferase [Butyrivibrio sp.]|nr:ribosomal protein S18-alanine N-acetyltransferase [Muribaculum sp.]MCM1551083.1 ribosomal protein S18-alanine N-acetyltransferase [Butyrivibrio sp.]
MTTDVLIRPLRAGDSGILACMEREIFTAPWTERMFAELLTRDYSLYLVAETDGQVVGCAGLTMLGEEGDIDKVMVDERFRRQGVAAMLLRELIDKAGQRGITSFTLEVRESNRPAIRLYERFGFRGEGVRPGFYEKPAEDALIMWRRP